MSVPSSLRAASDGLMRDLAALSALEEEKRTLPMDDPRLVEIAEHIEVIAARVLAGSERQTELAKEAVDASGPLPTIDDVNRPPSAILEEWREVERRVAEAPEGSAEAADGRILIDHLRREYSDAYAQANRTPKRPA